jgi:uncharacterized ferritin-like protein (DUF455 family)
VSGKTLGIGDLLRIMPENTITQFAERVLFSDRLEEKLVPPNGVLSDSVEDRGSKLEGDPLPGRPADLIWRNNTTGKDIGRAKLPAAPALVNDERRGELLHFFANHELLATELMALVLLKFPDAPSGFRQDVLATLLEEQNHTKWYLGRMAQCGVHLGDLPVSGFFWNSVAPMATPLDYVTRLSLTFEQANLDYSRHYGKLMRHAGDTRTAGILDRIYRDEIGHVGAGLKWFRHWKANDQTDWQAFQKHLIFPLSPSRAKANGAAFNAEGRLEAGLDEDYVRSLANFERSNGRTPNVFWFCPDAERQMAATAAGKSYHPNRAATELTEDLGLLPAFLARPDDVVLVSKLPSIEHCERLRSWGFSLPEFEAFDPDTELAADSLTTIRKLHQLRPWAWCPSSAKLADCLAKNSAVKPPHWNENLRRLFSKSAWNEWLEGPGVAVDSIEKIEDAINSLNCDHIVLKAPFAASGSGLRRWQNGDEKVVQWARRIIDEQGTLLIEPWRERVFDFSVQYEVDGDRLRQLGWVRVHNRDSGAFVACSVGPKFCHGLDTSLARFLMTEALPSYDENGQLAGQMIEVCTKVGYQGPLGVDAFVYRNAYGDLALRTVCEINPRFTMGRLAIELGKKVAAGHWLRFSIERGSPAETEQHAALDSRGRLSGGCVVLNEYGHWRARLEVSKAADFS